MTKRSRSPSAESIGSSVGSRSKDKKDSKKKDADDEEYSYEYEEYTVSEYSEESSSRRKEKLKKDKKAKKKNKKDKKKAKKEAKKQKKKDKKAAKKDKKESKKARRRSPSATPDSRSPSPKKRRRRSSSSDSRRRNGGGGYGLDFGGMYHGGPGMYGAGMHQIMPGTGIQLPGGVDLAEVCDKAARAEKGATVEDDDVTVENPNGKRIKPDTFDRFDEIKEFPKEMRNDLKKFPRPSQIQSYTWPLLLDGKDIIGIAATGSGKTLAFLLPAFADMLDRDLRPEREGAGCLVLAPTRELAQQTEQEAEKFGRSLGLKVVAMYGGAPKGDQMAKYRRGVHTIVACPGRLNDFIDSGSVQVDNCKKFVLDEADRMLDMGFEPQIRKILNKVPRNRHTMFFTATWPKEVRNLADDILDKPYKVMIGNRQTLKGNQDITQVCQVVPAHVKQNIAFDLLKQAGALDDRSECKVLIFCQTKRGCEALSRDLIRYRVPAASIHGDKDQRERDQALNGLKRGDIKVLVATDVAARGLDIKGIGLVLNFDPANNNEDYVHRIGRTGRAGVQGFAITLLTPQDAGKARGIIDVMERTDQFIGEDLRDLARSAKGGKGGGQLNRYAGGGFGGGFDGRFVGI